MARSSSPFNANPWSSKPISGSGAAKALVAQPKLPPPPKASGAALVRLAAAVARIPSSGRGANSSELFLP